MTVRKRKTPNGESRLFIEIRYRTVDGRTVRFRRDAQIQTKYGAQAEERRLFAELERTGTLAGIQNAAQEFADDEPLRYTFTDAVRQFRSSEMATLKPSTRFTYNHRLNETLVPRFGAMQLTELAGDALTQLDAELAREKLAASTRRNLHIVFRSVLRSAVNAGLLATRPPLPKLPRVGRKVVRPMHRADLEAILLVASSRTRLAFALAAFAGLRAGEVRGLRWSDIDLKGKTLTVRHSITRKETTSPKSGDHRVVPLAGPILELLRPEFEKKASPWAPVALTSQGKPWGESGLNQAFKRAQKRAERTGWCFHDLRHFFVTELFRRRAPAPAVQKLAGHADLATTQRYADMVASDMREAIALLEGNDEATGSARGQGNG